MLRENREIFVDLTFSVHFVDNQMALPAFHQMLGRIQSAVACGKVKWRLIVVVLQIDGRPHFQQTLNGLELAIAGRVMEGRTAKNISIVQQIVDWLHQFLQLRMLE